MAIVREDEDGLFVEAGGYIARPGAVRGYAHAFRMDDGGLVPGAVCKARHVAGSQLTRITTTAGDVLHWHHEGPERNRGMTRHADIGSEAAGSPSP